MASNKSGIFSVYLVGHEGTKMAKEHACKLFELSVPIKPITSGT